MWAVDASSLIRSPPYHKHFPSTDFHFPLLGKREYLRAINSAVTGLSKTRGQKLTFLVSEH